MSGYPTIRTKSDYFKGFRVRLFGIKYYLTNSVSDFFWICGKIWEKEGDIWCEIFDFLGIRIRLFEILNYPNRSESDFLISDNICIRLFGIRSFTSINSSEIKIMIFFFSLEIHIDVVFSSLEMNWMMLHGWPYLLYQNDSPWNVQRIKTHSRLKPKKSVLNLWVKLTSSHKRILS